jgi:hypothetical protein
MQSFAAELKAMNARLWDLENEIRKLPARHDFDGHFIALARSVYSTDDRRARLK